MYVITRKDNLKKEVTLIKKKLGICALVEIVRRRRQNTTVAFMVDLKHTAELVWVSWTLEEQACNKEMGGEGVGWEAWINRPIIMPRMVKRRSYHLWGAAYSISVMNHNGRT